VVVKDVNGAVGGYMDTINVSQLKNFGLDGDGGWRCQGRDGVGKDGHNETNTVGLSSQP